MLWENFQNAPIPNDNSNENVSKNVLLKRFLHYFIYLASLNLLNVSKLYWIGDELLKRFIYLQ